MREVLYIRDDDYRLSFRYGNFATLTNLKDKDIARIVEYRLSPLYVSVHATDPVVRRYLLRNPDAPDVLEQLTYFAQHGLQFHTQVVLTPGTNDGAVLEQTLDDLYRLGVPVLSVSVVPVGLTEYSKHSLVREPTEEECRAALDTVRSRAVRARRERGITWAHGADELYLHAGVELPPAAEYDGFQQVENGVGAVRYLEHRILEDAHSMGDWAGRRIGVFTGTSMGRLMPQLLDPLEGATGASFELHPLENTVFGSSVTTAGLLPGKAFIEALQQANHVDLALLPAESVNDDGLFIDDVSFEEVAGSIDTPVWLSAHFTDALRSAVPA
jgi:putative radical SAM enzyme (TIGR03279 family)